MTSKLIIRLSGDEIPCCSCRKGCFPVWNSIWTHLDCSCKSLSLPSIYANKQPLNQTVASPCINYYKDRKTIIFFLQNFLLTRVQPPKSELFHISTMKTLASCFCCTEWDNEAIRISWGKVKAEHTSFILINISDHYQKIRKWKNEEALQTCRLFLYASELRIWWPLCSFHLPVLKWMFFENKIHT